MVKPSALVIPIASLLLTCVSSSSMAQQKFSGNPNIALYQCLTSLEKAKGAAAVQALNCAADASVAVTAQCCIAIVNAPQPSGSYINGQLLARNVTDQEVSQYYNCALQNTTYATVNGVSDAKGYPYRGDVVATIIQKALTAGTITGDTAAALKASLDAFKSVSINGTYVRFDMVLNKSALTANAPLPTPKCPDDVLAISTKMINLARSAKLLP